LTAKTSKTKNHFTCHFSQLPSSLASTSTAIVDTGTTVHFLCINIPCLNRQPTAKPITAQCPNGQTMTSAQTADLDLPYMPLKVHTAHLFPGLAQHALLSVGELCDHGCITTFTDTTVIISHDESLILEEYRNHNCLWAINLTPKPKPTCHLSYDTMHSSTMPKLHQFLHAACFSPSYAPSYTHHHHCDTIG
jgi:hypothetical protein